MPRIPSVPPSASALAAEEEKILARWREKKIFSKTLAKKSPKGNFVFYEGPPTANAAPGVHHVLARVFKDIIVRFRTMQGYHVERKAGWDTHGLPVELQVEKKLGIKSKPEIETYGIAKFNAECKELVWKFKDDWEKLTERIGFWLDLEHPYVTYENNYIESVWAVIAHAHQRKLLYQGHKVVPYCPRCGTALSSHEVAQGYENIKEDSVYLRCKVTQGNSVVKAGDYILTWTTTPWTLPGNVALAVGPEFSYVRVEADGEHYVVAKDLVATVVEGPHKILSEFKGKELVGVSYQPLFPGAVEKGTAKVAWQVVPADFVTTTDGTGVVHTAVMYGEDDYRLGEQVGLPKQHTVGLDGKFLSHVTGLAGKYVKAKETEDIIYDHLKRNGSYFQKVPYAHDYPFCWRCSSPLLYYAKDSWFIGMTKIKDELLENAATINWVPAHIKEGRFGEWISGVKDWAISRERYWGTPLPVWKCQTGNSKGTIQKAKAEEGCGHWQVVGSVDDLKKLAGKVPDDLHRPFVDDVTFPCEKCGGVMKRVPEVMDVWLDSGSMPYAQYHYPFENEKLIDGKKNVQYPADYIAEAIDQTRGWFYTMLAVSTILGKGSSYKNVICLGHINDAKGQKMSKSKGNIINPWDVITRFGADPLRWYLYTINQPGEAKNFDPKQLGEVVKKVFLILQNVVSFYGLYVGKSVAQASAPKVDHVLDRWALARYNRLVADMTRALEQYSVIEAARPMAEFINDLSTWYVRRSRDRFKAGDKEAVATLGYLLLQVSKLLSPFTPFFGEWVYQQVGGKQDSVHLEDWPVSLTVDEEVLTGMENARKVVAEGLAQRMAAGIKIRQPLASVTGPKLPDAYQEIVRDELNVLEYQVGNKVTLDTKLTDALKVSGAARELIRAINALRKAAGLTIQDAVTITYEGNLDDVLAAHRDEILQKTRATEIKPGNGGEEVKVNDRVVKLRVVKK
ncbi:MAG: isoleucine--tRNA ligase [Patescibacteria group bacterium]|nr:isoleucine--tRNA ligase [Patescibacteria group bacterium]